MTEALTLTRQTVTLRAIVWREELAAELTQLGLEPADAEIASLEVLQRILDRAGWPGEVFPIAENPAADQEEGET